MIHAPVMNFKSHKIVIVLLLLLFLFWIQREAIIADDPPSWLPHENWPSRINLPFLTSKANLLLWWSSCSHFMIKILHHQQSVQIINEHFFGQISKPLMVHYMRLGKLTKKIMVWVWKELKRWGSCGDKNGGMEHFDEGWCSM